MRPINPKTEDEARQEALDWQNWQAEQELSMVELLEWYSHFETTGAKFNLTEEFAENGII